jgi:hypothetical protein
MPDALSKTLLDPADSAERQTAKLLVIAGALMRRVEQITDDGGAAYAQFQRAAILEDQVGARTRELENALALLNQTNAALEQAHRETEGARRNLANAIEAIQEGFALFDAQDVLVMCNSRFGMHMMDVRDSLKPGLTFDSYVERVSQSQYLELPEGQGPQDWAVQRRRRHHDTHVMFNVHLIGDRWLQVSEHRTPDGGTVILQTDVTDLIRLEREERGRLLDSQANMIRATLEHLDQGVCIFDAKARLVGWNQRLGALLGLPILRLGMGFDDLLRWLQKVADFGAMPPSALSTWQKGPNGRAPLSFELAREAMILSAFAQEMPDGGFVLSFTDITAERVALSALSGANETLEARVAERTNELEHALAEAERANASRSRFVAAASHDLLQPLSAAKLFIASVAEETHNAGARATLVKAQTALESVDDLLSALLDISKLEIGQVATSVEPLALGRLLDPLRDQFMAIAAAKGLRLTIVGSSVTVLSDPAYLRRILQNLISNAIRYTAKGRVLVGVRHLKGRARVEVWDTGPGIPEDQHDNIFREFHRLDAPASASEGMGLGLAIVERACAVLGHDLALNSVLNRGTCFGVTLPRVERSGPPTTKVT